jgi:hypothetical protein
LSHTAELEVEPQFRSGPFGCIIFYVFFPPTLLYGLYPEDAFLVAKRKHTKQEDYQKVANQNISEELY